MKEGGAYLVAQVGDRVKIGVQPYGGLEGQVVAEEGDAGGVTGRMCTVRVRGDDVPVHADDLEVVSS